MAAKQSPTQSATWNRDDRDLLVELRTTMQNVQADVADARRELKDISTGISARLLNLESNAVSRIELKEYDNRLTTVEAASNQWLGKQQLISASMGVISGLVASMLPSIFHH